MTEDDIREINGLLARLRRIRNMKPPNAYFLEKVDIKEKLTSFGILVPKL